MGTRIDELLTAMIEAQASDLHLKAYSHPVMRIFGQLTVRRDMPVLSPAELEELLHELVQDHQQKYFDHNHELDLTYSIPSVSRFRVNAAVQRGTTCLSFRMISWDVPTIERLGLPEVYRVLANRPKGLVLVTGPAGSGKSSTLAAMLSHINEQSVRRVVTIEDPIEYLHPDKKSIVLQREINTDAGSFSTAVRQVLRQDADVIVIGEMRDVPTMEAALSAAETGRLVLASLPAHDAVQAIERIIYSFPGQQRQQVQLQLSLVLAGVLHQLLLPRANGEGQVPAFEILIANPAICHLIREGKTNQILNVIQTGAQEGMITLDHHLAHLVRSGQVHTQDAVGRCRDVAEFQRLLGQKG